MAGKKKQKELKVDVHCMLKYPNNTIVAITDKWEEMLYAGLLRGAGFKGSRKVLHLLRK